MLNAGTLKAYLITARQWLEVHPYEVITRTMGNDDRVNPEKYVAPFTNSGMLRYLYTTPQNPMPLSAWPTMSDSWPSQSIFSTVADFFLAYRAQLPMYGAAPAQSAARDQREQDVHDESQSQHRNQHFFAVNFDASIRDA